MDQFIYLACMYFSIIFEWVPKNMFNFGPVLLVFSMEMIKSKITYPYYAMVHMAKAHAGASNN